MPASDLYQDALSSVWQEKRRPQRAHPVGWILFAWPAGNEGNRTEGTLWQWDALCLDSGWGWGMLGIEAHARDETVEN